MKNTNYRKIIFIGLFIINCLETVGAITNFEDFEATSYSIEETMIIEDNEKTIYHFPQDKPPQTLDEIAIFNIYIKNNMVFIIEKSILPHRDIYYIGEIDNDMISEDGYEIYTINIIRTIGLQLVLDNTMQLLISGNNIRIVFEYNESVNKMLLDIRLKEEVDYGNTRIIRKIEMKKSVWRQ